MSCIGQLSCACKIIAETLDHVVKYLLSSGADINLRDDDGQSPLFVASKYGLCDVVKYLLISGADINLCDDDGESPLFVASQKGEYDVVKCLLSSGAEINLRNKRGQSPLFVASKYGLCDVVKYLFSSDADINLRDNRGQSALFVASEEGQCDVVKCLLSSDADINLNNEDGQSPLFVASSFGYYNIVILLTAHGALREENVKTQYKTISKRTNDSEIFADSNPCGYPEEEIRHSTEKQEEEKEAIYILKVQEGKEETILTREQEEMYRRETKEGNDETIEGRKEQTKVEKGELINPRKEKEATVEIDDKNSSFMSVFCDFLHTDDDATSPLSIAIKNGHFDIVKHILENTTDFDLSHTGKSPLFL